MASGKFRPVDPAHFSFAIDGICRHIISSVEGRRAVIGSGEPKRERVESDSASACKLVVRGLLSDPKT